MVHWPAPPHGEKPEPAPRWKFPPRAASAAAAQGAIFIPPNPSPRLFFQAPGLNDGPSPNHRGCLRRPYRSVGTAASWATCATSVRSGKWGRWSRWLARSPLLPVQWGAYCIPVRLQGSEHRALLDSGAMQTLIQQSLVRPEGIGGESLGVNQVHA